MAQLSTEVLAAADAGEARAAAALAQDARAERLGAVSGVELEPEPEVAPLTCKQEPGRGWCYRASRDLPAQTALLCSAPDISALYTDHTADFCASCFQRGAPEQDMPLVLCQGCERFALCVSCDEGGALRRWHEGDECAAFKRIPAVRLSPFLRYPTVCSGHQRFAKHNDDIMFIHSTRDTCLLPAQSALVRTVR